MRIAVVILTYNEEVHLARAIESVRSFASEIHVVDSFSTDSTVQIAEASGAKVLMRRFQSHSHQFAWALTQIGSSAEWIMRLDADEIIEHDLATKIQTDLPALPHDVVGVTFDRKHFFLGRWIRHGGRYPLTMLRLFRRGHGRVERLWMDEHIFVENGRTTHFDGGFADHDLKGVGAFVDKHNGYATREAVEVLGRELHLFDRRAELTVANSSRQAVIKRWWKQEVYRRLPFPLASFGYFLFRYVVQFGFLDGREGLVYHVLQGFWYRFLVGAKLTELKRDIAGLEGRAAIISRLEALTGLALSDLCTDSADEAGSSRSLPAPVH